MYTHTCHTAHLILVWLLFVCSSPLFLPFVFRLCALLLLPPSPRYVLAAKATFEAISKTYTYLTPDLWADQKITRNPFIEHSDFLNKSKKGRN